MYNVYAEEVFGQPDEADERTRIASFDVYEEAVAYCQKMLKKDLAEQKSKEKMMYYEHHGREYWISPEPEGCHFSSRSFVQNLCEE